MSDLICGGFALVVILASVVVYRRSFSRGYWNHEHDPLFFDRDNPKDVYEVKCIQEQRRWGYERGGPIVWRDD